MFCTKCGKVNKDEAKFCIGCGTALSAPVREVVPPEMLHPAGMIAPPILEEPAAKKKRKAPIIIAAVAAVLVLAGGGCFLMRDKLASLFGSEKSEEPSALDAANQKAETLYKAAEDAAELVSEEGCRIEDGCYLVTDAYEKPDDVPDAGDVSVSEPYYFLYLLSEEYEELEELEGFGLLVEDEEIVSVIVEAESTIGAYPTPVVPEDAEDMKLDEEALEYAAGEREEENEEENEEEPVPETEAVTEAPTEPDFEQLYYDYLQEEFVPVYGLADLSDAQVTMESYGEENWLSPEGVYSAYIEDLNGDDVPEMVVFCTNEQLVSMEIYENDIPYYVMTAYLFTFEDGEVTFQSELECLPTNDNGTGELSAGMRADESNNFFYYITAIDTGEDTYFMFECNTASAFGDGGGGNYWAIRYHDGVLENVFSVTKVAGGSVGFVYNLYEFENGQVVSDSVLWSDGYDGDIGATYDGEFVDALKAVYEDYGITTELADADNYAYFPSGGFDADAPEAERILEYLVSSSHNISGNSFNVDFMFTAEDYTDLRDHVTYTPQMGMLQGTVIDAQTGEPIEGAYVEMNSSVGLRIYDTVTGADGTYTFEAIAGEYILSVGLDGYERFSETVMIEEEVVLISSTEMEAQGVSEAMLEMFLSQEDDWTDRMGSTSGPGGMSLWFRDIDMDGICEIFFYGYGGASAPPYHYIYRYQNGAWEYLECPGDSKSYGDSLTLYRNRDNGEYVNINYYSPMSNGYQYEEYNLLSIAGGSLQRELLFMYEYYPDGSHGDPVYADGSGNTFTESEYHAQIEAYLENLEEVSITMESIDYRDFLEMSDTEKIEALYRSYEAFRIE